MYREFTRADKDNSGALSIEEFFGTFELTFVTPLAKRAFYSFDLDGSGELDYGEFTPNFLVKRKLEIPEVTLPKISIMLAHFW